MLLPLASARRASDLSLFHIDGDHLFKTKGETHLERLNSTRDIEIVGEPRGTFQTKADMEGGNAVAIGISKKSK